MENKFNKSNFSVSPALDLFGNTISCNTKVEKEIMRIDFSCEISAYTNEMAKLFTAFSNLDHTCALAREYEYDIALEPLIRVIEIGAKRGFVWQFVDKGKKPISLPTTNNVVVCFSGGKDSTATAIYLKNKGYNVYLYFVKGINKSYPNEVERACEIAKTLELPIHVERIKQIGKTTLCDNPVKNQLIASLALDYAIKNGIGTNIAFGDYPSHSIKDSSFQEAWTDCVEVWDEYKKYIMAFVHNFNLFLPIKNSVDAMCIIKDNGQVLKKIQGCVLPHRFREMTKKNNEKKFGLNLLPYRCGSCWKCCMEYIFYADTNVLPYNEMFYHHCLDVLLKKSKELHPQMGINGYEDVHKAYLANDFNSTPFFNKYRHEK